jgi:glycine/D-amino acid oxidase-like deaminating enzyme/nitrite reductase/ring-hydroxylating ferredoxin subunit
MAHSSLWQGTATKIGFPSLAHDLEADVVIIGGGITGITAAHLLSRAGRSVIVLEAMKVGLGTTGNSTGNLHVTLDQSLYRIREKWGQQTATAIATSRLEALAMIERVMTENDISCDFRRRAHYLFPLNAEQARQMEQEHQTLLAAGLDAAIVHDLPLPFRVDRALRIENQAQFQPLSFVRQLAKAIASESCLIFEDSKVVEIDDDRMVVATARGRVRAGSIIMATHTPKGFNVLQTELFPYREYGIAARLRNGAYPEGLFWTMEKPSHSIRSYDWEGKNYLIVIGEEHKVGQQAAAEDYFRKVEEFTHSHFMVDSIDYRWSAQNYQPADGLPFIGRSVGAENLYLATGFATNGLLYGPLAAMIITDRIRGRRNQWEDLYSARRFTPVKSAKGFLKENVDVARHYIKDYLSPGTYGKPEEVQPGEGKLVKAAGEHLAVSRDAQGKWAALSPICTHLECIVHWNPMEKSWDCPCHGSRFSVDGEVIEGPAIRALDRKKIPPEA